MRTDSTASPQRVAAGNTLGSLSQPRVMLDTLNSNERVRGPASVCPLRAPAQQNLMMRAAQACPENEPPRIVLTGGPCGGKSTALAALDEALNRHGYTVKLVPEAATLLIADEGVVPHELGVVPFELMLTQRQMDLEDSALRDAMTTRRPVHQTAIICDRGVNDNLAYLETDQLKADFFARVGVSEAEFGAHRYHLVLHLVTAAHGALPHYNYNKNAAAKAGFDTHDECKNDCNNSARIETPEQAQKLDDRTRDGWSRHPYRIVFDNHGQPFNEKIDAVLNAVLDFYG